MDVSVKDTATPLSRQPFVVLRSMSGIDGDKYKANMSAALDQYIERVEDTPCMKTQIHLSRVVEEHIFVEKSSQLLVFLKGSEKDKEDLKQRNPTLYNCFSEIWQVRNNQSIF